MSYLRKRYKYGNIIEVRESHTARYGAPGQPRQKKEKPTPEAVKRQNQRRREEKTARIIAANFEEGDLVRTLTFARDRRPADMAEAQATFKRFYQSLRREYRKRYYDLYWIANIECTQRGAWHVHFICNAIFGASEIIKALWEDQGGVYDQTLKDIVKAGKDLGAYMAKTPDSTKGGEHKVSEAKQTHSKNLTIPEPETAVISGWKMTDAPRPPKGYYLIKDSLIEGVNEAGYKYRRYKFARIRPCPPKERRWYPKSENTHIHNRRSSDKAERGS